jgi:haloacetate dehalogenase
MMWAKVAPDLAGDFTVIAPDLRGYGGRSKPATTDDQELLPPVLPRNPGR